MDPKQESFFDIVATLPEGQRTLIAIFIIMAVCCAANACLGGLGF